MTASQSTGPKNEISAPNAEALFGALFEQSAIGVAVFTLGGRFLRANGTLCRLLGYTEQELKQKTHLDVVHVEDIELAAVSRAQLISGKAKPRTIERRYLRKDGSTLWALINGTVVRDAAGTAQYTLTTVSDVSALRRSLRASEQRFRRMVEMSSDWYWVQDEQFRFIEVAGLENQGQDTDIVLGKARWELPGLGALPDRVWEQHRQRLERHESFSDFIYLRNNDAGELRYLSVSGEPLFDEQGQFKGYHGIGKDITERARDQKAIEDSEERYRALFEANPQPMWVVDAKNFAFLAVNRAAIRLYGYTQEEFLEMSADSIRPEEDVAGLLKAFEDKSNYRQRVWRHRKKSGEQMTVRIDSFNLDFDGKAARLAVIEDLTERVQIEERTREIEERYRRLLEERSQSGGG